MEKYNIFNTLSIEVGNTTTKCLITTTNLDNGITNIICKNINKTNIDNCSLSSKNKIFGRTLIELKISEYYFSKFISNIIIETLKTSNINIDEIHFVARSTGILISKSCLDGIIRSMTNGCLDVGFSINQLTGKLNKKYSILFQKYIKNISYDGYIASSCQPQNLNKSLVLNEMEGELACAGIKDAALNKKIDFRNPCVTIDLGTSLSGRIIGTGDPYSKAICNFYGYAGIVSDSIIRNISNKNNVYLNTNIITNFYSFLYKKEILKIKTKIMDLLKIDILKKKLDSPKTTLISNILNKNHIIFNNPPIIYCDSYSLDIIGEIGFNFYKEYGYKVIPRLIDEIMSDIVLNLITVANIENLYESKMKIGITGRAGITGYKQFLIKKKLKNYFHIPTVSNKIIFVDDGLARGASVLGRCINSIGVKNKPIGGNTGDKCILKKRIKIQNNKI